MIRTLTLVDALQVCSRMRALDRAGVQALSGGISDEGFAVSRYQTDGPAWTLVDPTGTPQAIFGLTLQTAWSAVAWLICADMTSALWRELIRFVRVVRGNVTDPQNPGYRHRVTASVLSSWNEARAFAQRLGLQHEGTHRGAGSNGEDIETWAIVGPVKGTA